jgi:hypothetical protein
MAGEAKVKTTRWDAADYLTTERHIEAYLEAAAEDASPGMMEHALEVVQRAREANAKMITDLETRFTPPPEAETHQWRFVARTETDPATGQEHVRETWVRADQFDRYQRRRFQAQE